MRVSVAGTGREYGIVRNNPAATTGYGLEINAPSKYADHSCGMTANSLAFADQAVFRAIKYWATAPWTGDYSFDVCARALADGSIRLDSWLMDTGVDEKIAALADGLRKYSGDTVAIQTNGAGRYYDLKVYNPLTGGFTLTATPLTLTAWSKICLCGGFDYSSNNTLSALLEYSDDGGSSWQSVPDDGDISGASILSGSIQIRAIDTLDNKARPMEDSVIDSLTIEIEGRWEAAEAPDPPTSLAVGTPDTNTMPLTWTDPASADRILVYYNTVDNSATAEPGAWADFGDQTATVGGLSTGTLYYFWAKSVSSDGGLSAFSTGTSGTTLTTNATVPTNFVLQSTARNSAVLTWTDGAGNSFYELFKGTVNNSASATYCGLADQGDQRIELTGLDAGTTYYFWIRGRASDTSVSVYVGSVTEATKASDHVPLSKSERRPWPQTRPETATGCRASVVAPVVMATLSPLML